MDRPERLIRAFGNFDGDKSGRVNTEAMVTILTTLGSPLSEEEVKEFIADADEDGWIDYKKFVNTIVFGS